MNVKMLPLEKIADLVDASVFAEIASNDRGGMRITTGINKTLGNITVVSAGANEGLLVSERPHFDS